MIFLITKHAHVLTASGQAQPQLTLPIEPQRSTTDQTVAGSPPQSTDDLLHQSFEYEEHRFESKKGLQHNSPNRRL
jgi:hypothetical protein